MDAPGGRSVVVMLREGMPPAEHLEGLSMVLSLVAEGRREADVFKWIESERACCDLGEAAIRRWVQEHWDGFLRARWIQHLEGSVYWMELGDGDFCFLQRKFQDKIFLVDRIIDRLRIGQENLEILLWAIDWNINIDDVFAILDALDVNSKRLIRLFDPKH